MMRIGDVATKLEISADTLRYYEKIKLMPTVHRSATGARLYSDKDLSRLRFIRRAQKMGFSLNEISQLLKFRVNPQSAKPRVRELALQKLEEIEDHLEELTTLRNELRMLTNLCSASGKECPIIESFDGETGDQ
ncbi:MAG: heavy metal-responsive transcriptional regulator [Gammaproteobacteria bacterium]|nr:heavy metal-responsive transcriptional regulator [Gammaproteobacteria bacterium]